jgi:signal transduction histidine kinase
LTRSASYSRPLGARERAESKPLAFGGAVLVGTATALLIAVLLLAPSPEELSLLALYVGVASVAAIVLGWSLLKALDRVFQPSLAVRAFAGAAAGGIAALLNVSIVARLMFVNTSHDLRLLLALIASGTAVSVFFAVGVAAVTSRRVEAITRAIERLASGDYTPPATSESLPAGREVTTLAEDVESLRLRLLEADTAREQMERERRELGTAISHDLRTPLASMRALIEALDDGVVEDPNEVRGYYGHLRRESQRLGRMIDDLFELAQLDSGALPLDLQSLALQDIVIEVFDGMRPLAARRGVELVARIEGAPPVLGLDPGRMERAIANLLRNAIEHSASGTSVEARLALDGESVVLAVRDQGEGIAATDLPRVWERFYRGDPSRKRQAGLGDGAGLGLAIVRGTVEAHGGSVRVSSTVGAGSTFELRLPIR